MPKTSTPKPKRTIQERLRRCRAEMARKNVSAYLVTNRVDQIYLTGFDGEDGAAIITPSSVHIITDGRFEETFRRQAPWARRHILTYVKALAEEVAFQEQRRERALELIVESCYED